MFFRQISLISSFTSRTAAKQTFSPTLPPSLRQPSAKDGVAALTLVRLPVVPRFEQDQEGPATARGLARPDLPVPIGVNAHGG